jgi:hypothetical protein
MVGAILGEHSFRSNLLNATEDTLHIVFDKGF